MDHSRGSPPPMTRPGQHPLSPYTALPLDMAPHVVDPPRQAETLSQVPCPFPRMPQAMEVTRSYSSSAQWTAPPPASPAIVSIHCKQRQSVVAPSDWLSRLPPPPPINMCTSTLPSASWVVMISGLVVAAREASNRLRHATGEPCLAAPLYRGAEGQYGQRGNVVAPPRLKERQSR